MIRFLFMISCLMVHPFITSSQQLFASGPIFDHDPHLSRAQKRSAEVATLPTVTVRGFLNFRTTVDGTVIVFTPASSSVSGASSTSIQPTSSYSSFSSSTLSANPFTYNTPSSRNEWSASSYHSSPLRNEWTSTSPSYTPRYRVSESSQVIEPTPSSSVSPVYPTGLVTVLAQTEVKDGLTTVHETKVIGTYIEGKYAQILRSSSFVGSTPTPVLPTKTFAVFPPSISSTDDSDVGRPVFDPVDNNSIEKQSNKLGTVTRITRNHRERRPPINFRSRNTETPSTPAPSRARRPTRPEGGRFGPWTPKDRERVRMNRFKVKAAGSELPPTARFTARDENEKEAAKQLNARLNRRLGVPRPAIEKPATMKPTRPKPASHEALSASEQSDKPVYNPPLLEGELSDHGSFDPNLFPLAGGKISPQKVVTETQTYMSEITHLFHEGEEPYIETVTLTTTFERTIEPSEVDVLSSSAANTNDLNFQSSSHPPIVLTKTYSVTDSSSRTSLLPIVDGTITATHTVTENFIIHKLITAYKTLPGGDEQLLEKALQDMDASNYLEHLSEADALIVPSIFNGNLDGVLPLITTTPTAMNGGDLIKATELPSGNNILLQQQPSSNAGFNANNQNGNNNNNNQNGNNNNNNQNGNNNGNGIQLQPSLNYNPGGFGGNSNFGPQIDLNNPLVLGAALQNPGLAAMYFGLQQLSQQATQYTTITKPTEYLTTDTVFNTKVLSFYDGRQTRTRTITEPASLVTRLVSTMTTEVSPVINPQYLVQQAQLQRIFATQLLNQKNPDQGKDGTNLFALAASAVQPQIPNNFYANQSIKPSTVTSTQVTVITTTETATKVYTLIYNAFSTKFRTVTSTNVFPTTVTSLITKTITNTATFPSFFG